MRKLLKTSGEHEAEISLAVTRFEKEFMGRGPLETRTAADTSSSRCGMNCSTTAARCWKQ
jgi:uncharacterized protein YbcI